MSGIGRDRAGCHVEQRERFRIGGLDVEIGRVAFEDSDHTVDEPETRVRFVDWAAAGPGLSR